MVQFFPVEFVSELTYLEQFAQCPKSKRVKTILTQDMNFIRRNLSAINNHLEGLGMTRSLEIMRRVRFEFGLNGALIYAEGATKLHDLFKAIISELLDMKFIAISPSNLEFFEQTALFENDVNEVFKEAATDIREAGTCIALNRNTASIFHSCRAAEFGLRRLAKRLKIKLSYPLKDAEWGVIIGAIESKIWNLKAVTRGRKKSDSLEFFSNMVSDCKTIKDTWRNCVMHARGSDYSARDAMAALAQVRKFLQRLAGKIKHTKPSHAA